MKRRTVLWTVLLLGGAGALTLATGYEAAYSSTPVGAVEIKTVPPTRLLTATQKGEYFQSADPLFMKLFRYLSANKVAMTIPVESEVHASRMHFIVGSKAAERALPDSGEVTVADRPSRMVASIGLRGAYTKERYEAGLSKLEAWLSLRSNDWVAAGSPTAVYWDGPFKPGAWKRSEIHIPIVARSESPAGP